MSGIYGILKTTDSIEVYADDIARLSKWNKAYGQENENVRIENKFSLGCFVEKLSDTAVKSSPILKRNGKYAVIDALLYNRDEIIEKGQFPITFSDEELLFECIEKWGLEELGNINGDFAGAIYDSLSDSIILFRDHMGIRPLFYFFEEDTLIFSTDIRGLTSMGCVDVSVNEKWLWNKMTGTAYMSVEDTEFAGILCVKPASYIRFSCKEARLQKEIVSYWQLRREKIRLSSEEAYIKQLRLLITDSVNRRLKAASGLIGAEMSGGLDSSVIDILINRAGRECVFFSWSASPQEIPLAEDDERIVVEDICKQEKVCCQYREIVMRFDEEDIINRKMRDIGIEPDMGAGYFRRYVFPPYINTLQICQTSQYVRRCGAKVVFTGHGGDEGVSHRSNPYELFFNKEYWHYLQYMWQSTQGEKKRLYKLLMRCRKNLLETRKKLLSPYVGRDAAGDLLQEKFCKKFENEKGIPLTFAYDSVAYINSGGSRARLDVVALLGAYSGVRYIIPYLDYRVVDFAVSIPRHMFLKKKTSRYIFREAFKDIMPESLYHLNCKEDTSWKNVKKADNVTEVERKKEAEEYLARKKRLVEMLDKDYWKEYLNWETFEQWSKIPLDEADEMRDFSVFVGMDNCLSLQNMVTFSRRI